MNIERFKMQEWNATLYSGRRNFYSYEDIRNLLNELWQWITANTPVHYDPVGEKGRNEVDFYIRFVEHMEKMMKAVPTCTEISVVGP